MRTRRNRNTNANRAARRSNTRGDILHPPLIRLPPTVYGFPEKMYTKLRYCDTYGLASVTGSIAKQVINVNSTFDPDQTGTGHQPLYRDTYAAIYSQYSVVKARLTVTFSSNATSSAMIMGVVVDDDATTSTTITTLTEQSKGKFLFLPNNAGSISNRQIVLDWDAKAHLGIDPFSSDTYKTAVGSNPTQLSTVVIYANPADAASTTTTQAFLELEQWVLWTELSTPTAS